MPSDRAQARICSEPIWSEDSGDSWTSVRVFPDDGAVGTAGSGAGGKSDFFLGLGARAEPFLSSLRWKAPQAASHPRELVYLCGEILLSGQ